MVNLTEEKPKKKGLRPKQIKINLKESVMEGNLIDLPFIQYGRVKEPITSIEYTWKDSSNCERALEVHGSPVYGLPTEYEYDVLVALFRLHAKQHQMTHGHNYQNNGEINQDYLKVSFSMRKLAEELHVNPAGGVLKRLGRAIAVLKDTSFHGTIYDKGREGYVTKINTGFSIITNYNIVQNIKKTDKDVIIEDVADETFVMIDPFFIRSMSNSYFKYFNYEEYLGLGKSGVTKKLFLILNKWREGRDTVESSLQKLYDRIPLSKDMPAVEKKKAIKRACVKLKEKGVIKDFELTKEKLIVSFLSKAAAQKKLDASVSKYTTFTAVEQRLIEHGFTNDEIRDHINHIVVFFEDIKALLRYTDDLKAQYSKLDPKEFILDQFKYPKQIPEKYYNKYSE